MRSLATDEAVGAAAARLRVGLSAPGLDMAVAAYFSEPEFAGVTFADLGHNPANEIVPDDLLAVTLLDITWRPEAVRILLGADGPRFNQMLATLPEATDLWDASHKALERIDKAWDALTAIGGVGTATASKIAGPQTAQALPGQRQPSDRRR